LTAVEDNIDKHTTYLSDLYPNLAIINPATNNYFTIL